MLPVSSGFYRYQRTKRHFLTHGLRGPPGPKNGANPGRSKKLDRGSDRHHPLEETKLRVGAAAVRTGEAIA